MYSLTKVVRPHSFIMKTIKTRKATIKLKQDFERYSFIIKTRKATIKLKQDFEKYSFIIKTRKATIKRKTRMKGSLSKSCFSFYSCFSCFDYERISFKILF